MSTLRRLRGILAILACGFVAPPAVEAGAVGVFLRQDDGLRAVERTVPDGSDPVEFALAALAAGPSDNERAEGLFSALPTGTAIGSVRVDDQTVAIDFSADLLAEGLDEARLEAIFEQVRWTLRSLGLDQAVSLTVLDEPLWSYLPPVPKIAPGPALPRAYEALPIETTGTALAGKKVSLSPGHGLFWLGSYWAYARPETCSPLSREDLHNTDLMQYLEVYLLQDGATIKDYRCLDKNYGNHSTGNPWWYMSGSYWIQHRGYPCSIYASSTGDCTLGSGSSESSDSIRSRPLASNYDDTHAHISMHTNGYQGNCYGSTCPNGTCTYYDSSSTHAAWATVSYNLAKAVNDNIVDVIRTHYGETTWRNRSVLDSNGGTAETRIPQRAAILIELAFHDSCDRDALYLRDNFFRSATMWGVYKGICDYFGVAPTYGFYASEYVSDTIPAEMDPGQSYNVSITLRNRGVLWTEERQIRLGTPGENDPFHQAGRAYVSGEVDTAQTCTFNLTMTAPSEPGTYATNWQMLREGVTWFGPTVSKQIRVGPPPVPGDFDYDRDVDLDDFGRLQACLTGNGGTPTGGCLKMDLDQDSDVDQVDINRFLACVSGAGIPGNTDCGQ
ncbi:MAG: hypothetical protein GXY55_12655 [Phycisphaerae bacterium]|nr:hypothetical protein [Phycisphaerae bacterium]